MFKLFNTAFSGQPTHGATVSGMKSQKSAKPEKMHETSARVVEALRKLHPMVNTESTGDVANFLGITDQLWVHWRARGVPRDRVLDIAATLGVDPYWLRDNEGDMMRPYLTAETSQLLAAWGRVSNATRADVLAFLSVRLVTEPKK